MKTSLFTVLFVIVCIFNSSAQEILSSGGSSQTLSGISLNYTIGEPIIETLIGTEATLTQGFHQTRLWVTAIEPIEYQGYKITVYPNPTMNGIEIAINGVSASGFEFFVYDNSGKVLLSKKTDNELTAIDLQSLPPAIYFLVVQYNGKYSGTYKIQKQ